MGKLNIFELARLIIGAIGWKLFLWGNDMTEDQYWVQVWEQEKRVRGYLKTKDHE